MDTTIFIALVAFMALCYAFLSKALQSKMIDKEGMKRFQEESKKLSKELEEARKNKNQKRIDEVMKKQMDTLPQMNKVMMGQLKMMLVTVVIFMGIYWVLGMLDPSVKDDMRMTLIDDGNGCDIAPGDGIFTACAKTGPATGKWFVTATAFSKDGELGVNSTYLLVDTHDDSDTWLDYPKGNAPPSVSTDKRAYASGEEARITVASEDAERIELAIDQGTSFLVDLPVKVPLIEFQRIRHPQVFFIVMSLIFNLSISISMNVLKKQGLVK